MIKRIDNSKDLCNQSIANILDTFREGVLIVSGNLRIAGCNAAAAQAFRKGTGGLINKRLSEVVREAVLHDAFEKTLASGSSSVVRIELFEKDRQVFEVRVSPLEFGESNQAIGVFYDVTQVEHLDKVRQVFLSNISHELRTPLTSILAFVETLEDGAVDDEENRQRFLGVIRKNAERMRHLIDDISELSHIESGIVRIEPDDVELAKLISEVFSSLSAKAEARDVVLEHTVTPEVRVVADVLRLEQMLTNLVDNAIKFNRKEGTVTVRSGVADHTRIIEVSDTGEGIVREHLQRIFERFYRIDRARSREVGGTGLGLAIVKHLARLHGGEVTVSSNLGEGSTFRIELPDYPHQAGG